MRHRPASASRSTGTARFAGLPRPPLRRTRSGRCAARAVRAPLTATPPRPAGCRYGAVCRIGGFAP
jgi:hypothetical protein